MNNRRKYNRNDYPQASRLVAEHEALHTEHTKPINLVLHGCPITVLPGVFRPDLSMMGQNLVDALGVRSGDYVLDLGTGSGFQAILAAKNGAGRVFALDNQYEAVKCATLNVEANSFSNIIEVRQSDLFTGLKENEKFDLIFFNFPFPPFNPESEWQRANFDPGHQLLTKFLCESRVYLRPGSRIGMCWSDIGDTKYLYELAKSNFFDISILKKESKGTLAAYIFELMLISDSEV